MPVDPQTTSIANCESAAQLVAACLRRGVDHFFLAPGSRCTPLTVAVANQRDAHVVQHVDERGLAFACLGYGRVTQRPGVFICTSGTAVANAYPAVIEASLDHVPMLLLTSDRPSELRETGANQTIDQVKIFGDYTRWFFDLPCSDGFASHRFWAATVGHALDRATDGPAHVNCMFREPFGVRDDAIVASPRAAESPDVDLSTSYQWRVPKGRSLVIAGGCQPEEALAAERLADRIGCPYLADVTSGQRRLSYDLQLLRTDVPPADVILHVGGRVVSKRWWQFIDAHPPREYIHLTPYADRLDPQLRCTHVLRGELIGLCSGAHIDQLSPADFLTAWSNLSDTSARAASRIIGTQQMLTEPGIAQAVGAELPNHSGLLLGNSMPIREMDTFGHWEPNRMVRVVANRGASGIDGLIATTVGFAAGWRRTTTALVGDLAALHDLNSLALVANSSTPVVLIVINNDGGGIFHFLPIADETSKFERYFATPHGREFGDAAHMFSIDYHHPTSMEEFIATYRHAVTAGKSSLIEVRTDRLQNRQLHRQIEQAVREGAA